MSASQEKKKRQNGASPLEQTRNASETKKVSGAWIAGGVGVVVLVILAIFFAILNSGILHKHTTALTVGNHKVTPVMYNYFYGDLYNQGYSYVLGEDGMKDAVNSQIASVYAICDAAEAAGYTLSSDGLMSVTNQVSTIQLGAMSQGYSDDAYLANLYGTGSTLETYREYCNMLYLSGEYADVHGDSLEYSADEIHTYYDENQDSLISYTFRSYTCSVESGETDEDGNAVIDSAASEEMATAMAEEAKGDEAAFAQLARDNADADDTTYEDDDSTVRYNVTKTNIAENYADWLADSARAYGDTTAVENENGSWTVVMFLNSSASYTGDVVNIRHILVQPDDAEAEATSDEAKAKAQEILDEYLAGDQTEEAFTKLVETYSMDSSPLEGGLLENLYPYANAERSINDWAFDAARQPGDTGIVLASDGYHVLYFVGNGDAGNATDYRTLLAMREEDTSAWVAELGGQITVTPSTLGMKLTKVG